MLEENLNRIKTLIIFPLQIKPKKDSKTNKKRNYIGLVVKN
jgi:hypothetical protein